MIIKIRRMPEKLLLIKKCTGLPGIRPVHSRTWIRLQNLKEGFYKLPFMEDHQISGMRAFDI